MRWQESCAVGRRAPILFRARLPGSPCLTPRSPAFTPAASGIHAADPPSKPRCVWPAAPGPRHRAGGCLARLARGHRSARRRRRAGRDGRRPRAGRRERRDRRALSGRDAARPGGNRRRADRARRHAQQGAAGRQRHDRGIDGRALHATAAALGEPLWRHLAQGGPVTLPLPEIQIFGGGAHAGRRVDIQDFMVMALTATQLRPGAAHDRRGLSGGRHADAGSEGKLAGVADEGGFWPAFDSNEEALEMLVRAIEAAGYRARRRGRHLAGYRRLGVRPRRTLPAGAGRARARQRRHGRAC